MFIACIIIWASMMVFCVCVGDTFICIYDIITGEVTFGEIEVIMLPSAVLCICYYYRF